MKYKVLCGVLAVCCFLSAGCAKTENEEDTENYGEIQSIEEGAVVLDDENFQKLVNAIYDNPENYKDKKIYCYGSCNLIDNRPYVYRILSNDLQRASDHIKNYNQIGLRYSYESADASSFLGFFCMVEGILRVVPMDANGNLYDCYIEVSQIIRESGGDVNIDKYAPTEAPAEETTKELIIEPPTIQQDNHIAVSVGANSASGLSPLPEAESQPSSDFETQNKSAEDVSATVAEEGRIEPSEVPSNAVDSTIADENP